MDGRLLNIFFNNFISETPKSIYGINYVVSLNGNGGVDIKFTNPKNLSYNEQVLIGKMEEEIEEFIKYVGINRFDTQAKSLYNEIKDKFYYSMDGEEINKEPRYSNVYLNDIDRNEIKKICKSINYFNWNDKEESLDSPIDTEYLNMFMEDTDHLVVEIRVKFLNPIYNNSLISISELSGKLSELFDNDSFYDYYREEFPGLILNYIWDNPLILDKDYMFATCNVDFYSKEGPIKWWVN